VASGPSVVELLCRGVNAFDIDRVVMTAVRAGTLTTRSMDTGAQTRVGSGQPRIFMGHSDGPRPIVVSDTFKLVRRISLPAGRWSVLAKLWFEAAGEINSDMGVLCRLRGGGKRDGTELRYANNPSRIGPMFLALTYESVEPGWLELRCRRTHADGSADAMFIRIVAMKLGSLVQRSL
jgi:hypothetical protein